MTLGVRLASSKFPAGYEIITYGRGTWLIHMLREMLRDASRTSGDPNGNDQVFLALLRNVYQRYQGKEITNADFEQAVEEVLPKPLWFENRKSLDWFFDGWVNGTAFPHFAIKDARFSTKTGKPMVSATVLQNDAPDDLVTSIPVYGVVGDNKVYLGRVFAEGQETRFSLPSTCGGQAPCSRSVSDGADSAVIADAPINLPYLVGWHSLVGERFGVGPLITARELSRPSQNILVRCQSFESYGATRMQFAGRDADLGPESVPKTICKARRRVVKYSGRIDLCQKTAPLRASLGHDRLGVRDP